MKIKKGDPERKITSYGAGNIKDNLKNIYEN